MLLFYLFNQTRYLRTCIIILLVSLHMSFSILLWDLFWYCLAWWFHFSFCLLRFCFPETICLVLWYFDQEQVLICILLWCHQRMRGLMCHFGSIVFLGDHLCIGWTMWGSLQSPVAHLRWWRWPHHRLRCWYQLACYLLQWWFLNQSLDFSSFQVVGFYRRSQKLWPGLWMLKSVLIVWMISLVVLFIFMWFVWQGLFHV